jgi:hypothetical protein
MSNALKSAAESTVHTLSDFVEGARDRLEDVIENVEHVIGNVKDELPPPLHRAKDKRHTGRWVLIAVAAVLFVVGMMARRRSHDSVAEQSSKDSAGSRLTERSLAVS